MLPENIGWYGADRLRGSFGQKEKLGYGGLRAILWRTI